jgi:hypothetical protein
MITVHEDSEMSTIIRKALAGLEMVKGVRFYG